MPAARGKGQEKETVRDNRETLDALICDQVMSVVGQPGDLLRVQVKQLWDCHYRVNVLVGADVASARIADSFFVVADTAGKILTSTPKLAKHY
jgi:hypothetical protein